MLFRTITGGLGLISMTAGLSLTLSPPSLSVEQAVEGFQRYQQTNEVQIVGQRPLALGALLTLSGFAGMTAALLLSDLAFAPVTDSSEEGQALSSTDPPPGQAAKSSDPTPDQDSTQPPVRITCLDDALYQGVSFADLAQTSDYETRVRLLAKSLKTFEGGWIWRLLRCPCLLVIGRPGAGKSSLAGAISIIRELLGITLSTTVSDPNAHLKLGKNVWFDRWDIRGARDAWDEIGEALVDMYQRFADCTSGNHGGWVFDEVTCYKDHVNADKLRGFLGQVTSKARATKDYVTVVSHNDTLQNLGGKEGEAGLKDDMVALYIQSVSDSDGNLKPAGHGLLKGAEYTQDLKAIETPIHIPRWLDAAYLCQLFPEIYGASDCLTAAEVLAVGKRLGSAAEADVETLETADMTSIKALKAQIEQVCGVSLEISAIRRALTMLRQGEATTSVIEQGLGLSGRHYQTGKQAFGLLQRFLTPISDK